MVTALNLGFVVLCEDSYPTVLAFSFLDEIQKEFLVHYDSGQVQNARRPYAFIEFGEIPFNINFVQVVL